MKIQYKDQFICSGISRNNLNDLKAAGFQQYKKTFVTSKLYKAARLRKYFDRTTESLIDCKSIKKSRGLAAFPYLPVDKRLYPYQLRGFKFAVTRNHSYLAFEQRLGKTPLAISIMNAVEMSRVVTNDTSPILLVVPPFLISHWIREIGEWGIIKYNTQIIEDSKKFSVLKNTDILILPDSLMIYDEIQSELFLRRFALAVVDEAHRFSNDSGRSNALYGGGDFNSLGLIHNAEYSVLLSGTPLKNSPADLYKPVSSLAFNLIKYMPRLVFRIKYCGAFLAKVSNSKKVWIDKGSTNEDELREKLLNKFILRETREKNFKHLKNLKTQRCVILDGKLPKKIIELEKVILKHHTIEDLIGGKGLGGISSYRKALAKFKIDVAAEYIENDLQLGNSPLLIFAIHTDLILGLKEKFKKYNLKVIYGKTKVKERDLIQQSFQENKLDMVIANIHTMQGLNFSKAKKVICVESSWTSSDNDQATDRPIDITQSKKILVDHLVLANTLDEYVITKVLNKQTTINKILN